MYINHTRLQLIYSAFYRPDFYKHSLTKHSAENLFQNKRPSLSDTRPNFWITQPSFQSLKRENQELDQQFKKLGRNLCYNMAHAVPVRHAYFTVIQFNYR